VLKEYAEFLAQPANILNSSYYEQKLPSIWKHADIMPLPKLKQVSDPKKELQPISLTPALSKIAEDFVVSIYIKLALEKVANPNQFCRLLRCASPYKYGAYLAQSYRR